MQLPFQPDIPGHTGRVRWEKPSLATLDIQQADGTYNTWDSHASGTMGSTIPQTIEFSVNYKKEMARHPVPQDFRRTTEPALGCCREGLTQDSAQGHVTGLVWDFRAVKHSPPTHIKSFLISEGQQQGIGSDSQKPSSKVDSMSQGCHLERLHQAQLAELWPGRQPSFCCTSSSREFYQHF